MCAAKLNRAAPPAGHRTAPIGLRATTSQAESASHTPFSKRSIQIKKIWHHNNT